MPKTNWTHEELRAKLDEQADAGLFNARAVQTILRRREAGLTRQKTTAEIAAMYCTEHHAWKANPDGQRAGTRASIEP
jgi:hypothetical protein